MTKKQAILKSIEHWEKNIELSKNCRGKISIKTYYERRYFEISWNAIDCALCDMYNYYDELRKKHCYDELRKKQCPLLLKHGMCDKKYIGNAWGALASAVTWGVWRKHARRLLKQLKSLLGA